MSTLRFTNLQDKDTNESVPVLQLKRLLDANNPARGAGVVPYDGSLAYPGNSLGGALRALSSKTGLTRVTTLASLAAGSISESSLYLDLGGRSGVFHLRNLADFSNVRLYGVLYADLSALDTAQGLLVKSTVDSTKCWVRDIVDGLYVDHFGARPYQYETDMATAQLSGAAIQTAWFVAQALGLPLRLNTGYYRCEVPLNLRCNRQYSSLVGTPANNSFLWFRADAVSSPNINIYYEPYSGLNNGFFYEFTGFRAECNVAGIAVAIGSSTADGQGRDINNSLLSFVAANYMDNANARTLVTRWCFSCHFHDMTVNGGGPKKTQFKVWSNHSLQFAKITKPSIGNGFIGFCLEAGTYHVGNTMDTPDLEELDYCLSFESANCVGFTFISGQYVWYTKMWNQTQGSKIMMLNPNPATGTSWSSLFNSTYGQGNVRIKGNVIGVSTPAVPANGVYYQNTTGSRVRIIGSGGTAVYVWRPGVGAGQSVTGGFEVHLDVGESVRLDYTAAPSWTWYAWE